MRAGFLGVAHGHAGAYMRSLFTHPDATVIGVADENHERGQTFADAYHIPMWDDYDHLLASQPDAVVICAENIHHHRLTFMAADAGAHILCEKPLATTIEDAQQMVQACNTARVSLMTAFPVRFSAPIIETKQVLDSGVLGTLYACVTTNQGQIPPGWFIDKTLAGGGAITDHTVHVVDVLRWYLGCEVTEVFAESTHVFAPTASVETGGLILLTFENGVFATIDCSWSRPVHYPTWGNVKLEITGEGGVLVVNAFKQTLSVYSDQTARADWRFWGSDMDQGLIAEFVDAVTHDRPPSVTGYDGYKAVEVASAAYQSLHTKQPISLLNG